MLKHELNNDFNVGRVQFSVAEEVVDSLLDPTFLAALAVGEAERRRRADETDRLQVRRSDDEPLKEARAQLDALRVKLGLGPTVKTMVMHELHAPRTTYVFKRGDFLQPDKELGPISAECSPGVARHCRRDADGRPFDRLDFARWLVAKDHPLTARVTVNRVWMRYFGRGLVETENDFGSQGSHADASGTARLAGVELCGAGLVAQGIAPPDRDLGDLPPIVARTSRRGRRSIRLNLLLARQNRLRLDAEIVRDAALARVGKAVDEVGRAERPSAAAGRSVRLYAE